MTETVRPAAATDGGEGFPLEEPGLWVERIGGRVFAPGTPALFLDRDGTINADSGYPSDPAGVVLLPHTLPAIEAANAAGIPVVIVTNQSGIARGYFGWKAFAAVNARVLELLGEQACMVDMVLACAYHEAGKGVLGVADHPMRKPNPGMLLLAGARLGIDLGRSIMAGDKADDMEAARRAGLKRGWLVGIDRVSARDRKAGFALHPLASEADSAGLSRSTAVLSIH